MKNEKRAFRLPAAVLLAICMLFTMQLPVMADGGESTVTTLKSQIPIKVQQQTSGSISNTVFKYQLIGQDEDSIQAMSTLPKEQLSGDNNDTYTFSIRSSESTTIPMSYDSSKAENSILFRHAGTYTYRLQRDSEDSHSGLTSESKDEYTIRVYISNVTGADGQLTGGLKLKAVTAQRNGDSGEKVADIIYSYRGPSGGGPVTPAKKYTLTYDTNGGSPAYDKETYSDGDDAADIIRKKTPTKDGYSFVGWYEDEALKNPLENDESFIMDKDRTVYAKWEESKLNKDDHYAYIVGYPDGSVQPQGNITRAEVGTIFFRLLTEDARKDMWKTKNDFSDVKSSNWYNNAISTVANGGIVKGYEDGTFRPDNKITRAEFATIAARFDPSDPVTDTKFSDVDGHWAEKDIAKAEALGYIDGYGDGTFRPDKNITRAEAMTLINRVLDRDTITYEGLLKEKMITWWDNMDDDAWYYAAVQEATNSHKYDNGSGSEKWTEMRDARDWAALEKEDSELSDSANPGDVMKSAFMGVLTKILSVFS